MASDIVLFFGLIYKRKVNLKDNYLFITRVICDISQVIFPTYCAACNHFLASNEVLICTKCRHQLPVITSQKSTQLIKNQLFAKQNSVTHFCVLFRYEKDSEIQHLIHNFKYKNSKKLGQNLAFWQLKLLTNVQFIDKIDLVVPVPMHYKKQKKKGYNQVSYYAKTLAQELNAKYLPKVLIKNRETKTQSKQTRKERYENILNSIDLNPDICINNKHILLVDDVITTGATMQACMSSLLKANGVQISIAAIAITLFDNQ